MDIAPETRDSDDIRFPNLTQDIDRHLQGLPRDFNFDFDLAEPWLSFYSPRRLGVTITPLSDQLAAYFGVNQGVLVSEVAAGSAAEAAGLKAGDVITAVKGQAVSSSDDVVRELRQAGSGSSIEMRVVRDRKELTVSAKMPERTTHVRWTRASYLAAFRTHGRLFERHDLGCRHRAAGRPCAKDGDELSGNQRCYSLRCRICFTSRRNLDCQDADAPFHAE